MRKTSEHIGKTRRGMAIGLVLMIGLIILVLGIAMIATSGSLLRSTVDAKQRIRSRYAAESMVALQIAATMEKASLVFGSNLALPSVPLGPLHTGEGEQAKAEIINLAGTKTKPLQEVITTGLYKGLKGLKIPILIKATGIAPGGAKTQVDAEIRMYQIPLFQFGVFYEGNLEISPGPSMTVGGPVHTNSNAFFRAFSGTATLALKGPVTAVGTIYQWSLGGPLRYLTDPEDTTSWYTVAGLNSSLAAAIPGSILPARPSGGFNVAPGSQKLTLPIGGANPVDLIAPHQPSDPPELARQQFDAKIVCPATGYCSRFINGVNVQPPWITGPRVFYDRREQRWVKVWDFDVGVMASNTVGTQDSIFYLADNILMTQDRGVKHDIVINAFRIVNGAALPRNLTIASANPIYILGDFNVPQAGGPCFPADATGPIPNDQKYCNAMIAANAVTLLSPNWPRLAKASSDPAKQGAGSLEQDSANLVWTIAPEPPIAVPPPGVGPPSSNFPNLTYPAMVIRVNAAILTGNKPTPANLLPPVVTGAFNDNTYESVYEGGWHNTIRFLEDLQTDTVVFNGSFVCIWSAEYPGLRRMPIPPATKVISGYYMPPTRKWSFDPRFSNLNNMPPGTPYLSTGVFASWSEH